MENDQRRPRSVTVIAWFLIITGAFSLIYLTLVLGTSVMTKAMQHMFFPLWFLVGFYFADVLASLVCGLLMLPGVNSARLFYLIWLVVVVLVALVNDHFSLLVFPALVRSGFIFYYLVQADAVAFFKSTAGQAGKEKDALPSVNPDVQP